MRARSVAMNRFRENLASGVFSKTIEVVPASRKLLKDHLAQIRALADHLVTDPGFSGFSITDRVHSLEDHDPIDVAARIIDLTGIQPLPHFSGKGRGNHDLRYALNRMQSWGLKNLLLVSGDRLGVSTHRDRVRYLESVPALRESRNTGDRLFLGGAVCPFKYTEESAMSQYLKLGRKVSAGADFVITQLGFDMQKFAEIIRWSQARDYDIKIIANVMALTAGRARFIRNRAIPGIVISDDLLALLQHEELTSSDKGKQRAFERLALQITGLELLGYKGIQLTGIGSPDDLVVLENAGREFGQKATCLAEWNRQWKALHIGPSGALHSAAPAGGWYLGARNDARPSVPERIKFKALNTLHDRMFAADTVAYRAMVPLMKYIPADKTHGANRALRCIEFALKKPVVGCDTCGTCRLAQTQYVCPETCPKGLSNGPCGGSSETVCEYGHQECIHLKKYRLAKFSGQLDYLELAFEPAVDISSRRSCSWPNHFRGSDGT